MNSNLKKGIYIYILETTINNLYKIGVTEQKNGNRDFKRLFAYANGYRGCQIKRCIYFQKTTSNNIIDFDSLNKNFLNNLNHDIFMHTDKDHEFYLSQNINKSIEHYKKHFSSHLEKECVQRSFISEINIKIFDD
jgi:fructose-bisphosphate aldolase class 1